VGGRKDKASVSLGITALFGAVGLVVCQKSGRSMRRLYTGGKFLPNRKIESRTSFSNFSKRSRNLKAMADCATFLLP
jgi:hypothetical protein